VSAGRTDLEIALADARSAWPDIEVAPQRFESFLRERIESESDVRELVVGDLYLACACADGNPEALARFEERCMPVIRAALARLDAASIVDDVEQMVRISLLVGTAGRPLIATYRGRGNLRGWIRVIAVREAMRILRQLDRRVPVGDEALFDALAPTEYEDAKLEYLKQHYRDAFRRAFVIAVGKLERRERLALRMNVIDGRSIDEIAVVFRSHRSSAARWLVNARRALLEHTRSAFAAELAVSPSEVDSLIQLLQSSLTIDDGVFVSHG
jgi:RNA polymerase sigma-70 factor, ECF subfamily